MRYGKRMSIFASIDAGCYAVTHARTDSEMDVFCATTHLQISGSRRRDAVRVCESLLVGPDCGLRLSGRGINSRTERTDQNAFRSQSVPYYLLILQQV